MKKLYDVIIVGAGSGGAILSLLLARQGIDVLMLERDVQPLHDIRSEILQPNGQKVLDDLGLLKTIPTEAVHQTHQFDFFRIGKGRLCTFNYGDLPVPYNSALTAFSGPLHQHVLDATAAETTLTVLYGAVFNGLMRRGKTVMGVMAEHEGRNYDIRAKLVVGADGIKSAVRKALGIPAQVYQYPEGYLLGVLQRPPGFDHRSRYYIGRKEILGLLPVPNDQLYFFYLLSNATRAGLDAAGFESIKNAMAEIDPSLTQPLKQLTRLDQTIFRPCFRVRSKTWVADGAVIIGDAAHAMNPHVSQGRMQAMQDAVALSRVAQGCLAKGDCSALSLEAFERERRPHVEMLQRLGDEQTFFWNSASPVIQFTVDRVLRTLDDNARLRYQVLTTTAGLRQQSPFSLTDKLVAVGLLPDFRSDAG
ncbi:MAG TPA: FAD-dependent monooxygenase [Nitrospirales bacterium]|nr:FAD-dependent monooxygenase [Nitrospirales bacterium]